MSPIIIFLKEAASYKEPTEPRVLRHIHDISGTVKPFLNHLILDVPPLLIG